MSRLFWNVQHDPQTNSPDPISLNNAATVGDAVLHTVHALTLLELSFSSLTWSNVRLLDDVCLTFSPQRQGHFRLEVSANNPDRNDSPSG